MEGRHELEERDALLNEVLEYHEYAKRVTDDYYKLGKKWGFYKSCFLFFMTACLLASPLLAVATTWGWIVLLGAVVANVLGNSFFGAKVASCFSWGGMWGGVQYYLESIANEVHASDTEDEDERKVMRGELRCMIRQMRKLRSASWGAFFKWNPNLIRVSSLNPFPGGADAEWDL